MKPIYEIMHGDRKVAWIDTHGHCKVYYKSFMPFSLYLEETDNGYKVRYDKKEQLEALKKCIRPSQLVNGWTIWNADATMEVVLEGQESTGEDSGFYMTFAGEIPDFIRADAKAAHVTEWEVND